MEDVKVAQWATTWGDGSGSGTGDGWGNDWGDGTGDGSGSGTGDGWGNDWGYGWGDGSGSGSGNRNGLGNGWGSGDGKGNDWGSGYGNGYGDGTGDGWGNGNGDGWGDGTGDDWGNGNGYGSKNRTLCVNGKKVYYIDKLPTVIYSIHGDFACGAIVGKDYQLTPCYIAKDEATNLCAHGSTLRKAVEALQDKVTENMTDDERVQLFCDHFKHGEKYSGHEFFKWHHILTGSCEFGRNEFVRRRELSLEAEYSVDEFISLVENEYGAQTISRLKTAWSEKE